MSTSSASWRDIEVLTEQGYYIIHEESIIDAGLCYPVMLGYIAHPRLLLAVWVVDLIKLFFSPIDSGKSLELEQSAVQAEQFTL